MIKTINLSIDVPEVWVEDNSLTEYIIEALENYYLEVPGHTSLVISGGVVVEDIEEIEGE